MDEADNLADNIVVIDGGKVIAEGTPTELKAKIGSDRLEFTIAKTSDFEKAQKAVDGATIKVDEERKVISIASTGGIAMVQSALERLQKAKIEVENISLHRPTLDDVFLTLTGHAATKEEKEEKTEISAKKSKKKGAK